MGNICDCLSNESDAEGLVPPVTRDSRYGGLRDPVPATLTAGAVTGVNANEFSSVPPSRPVAAVHPQTHVTASSPKSPSAAWATATTAVMPPADTDIEKVTLPPPPVKSPVKKSSKALEGPTVVSRPKAEAVVSDDPLVDVPRFQIKGGGKITNEPIYAEIQAEALPANPAPTVPTRRSEQLPKPLVSKPAEVVEDESFAEFVNDRTKSGRSIEAPSSTLTPTVSSFAPSPMYAAPITVAPKPVVVAPPTSASHFDYPLVPANATPVVVPNAVEPVSAAATLAATPDLTPAEAALLSPKMEDKKSPGDFSEYLDEAVAQTKKTITETVVAPKRSEDDSFAPQKTEVSPPEAEMNIVNLESTPEKSPSPDDFEAQLAASNADREKVPVQNSFQQMTEILSIPGTKEKDEKESSPFEIGSSESDFSKPDFSVSGKSLADELSEFVTGEVDTNGNEISKTPVNYASFDSPILDSPMGIQLVEEKGIETDVVDKIINDISQKDFAPPATVATTDLILEEEPVLSKAFETDFEGQVSIDYEPVEITTSASKLDSPSIEVKENLGGSPPTVDVTNVAVEEICAVKDVEIDLSTPDLAPEKEVEVKNAIESDKILQEFAADLHEPNIDLVLDGGKDIGSKEGSNDGLIDEIALEDQLPSPTFKGLDSLAEVSVVNDVVEEESAGRMEEILLEGGLSSSALDAEMDISVEKKLSDDSDQLLVGGKEEVKVLQSPAVTDTIDLELTNEDSPRIVVGDSLKGDLNVTEVFSHQNVRLSHSSPEVDVPSVEQPDPAKEPTLNLQQIVSQGGVYAKDIEKSEDEIDIPSIGQDMLDLEPSRSVPSTTLDESNSGSELSGNGPSLKVFSGDQLLATDFVDDVLQSSVEEVVASAVVEDVAKAAVAFDEVPIEEPPSVVEWPKEVSPRASSESFNESNDLTANAITDNILHASTEELAASTMVADIGANAAAELAAENLTEAITSSAVEEFASIPEHESSQISNEQNQLESSIEVLETIPEIPTNDVKSTNDAQSTELPDSSPTKLDEINLWLSSDKNDAAAEGVMVGSVGQSSDELIGKVGGGLSPDDRLLKAEKVDASLVVSVDSAFEDAVAVGSVATENSPVAADDDESDEEAFDDDEFAKIMATAKKMDEKAKERGDSDPPTLAAGLTFKGPGGDDGFLERLAKNISKDSEFEEPADQSNVSHDDTFCSEVSAADTDKSGETTDASFFSARSDVTLTGDQSFDFDGANVLGALSPPPANEDSLLAASSYAPDHEEAVVSAVLEEPDDAKADIADSVGKPKKKNSKRKMKKSSAS